MNTKALKNKIFEITQKMPLHEREAQELAFKLFIDYACAGTLLAWVTKNNPDPSDVHIDDGFQCEFPDGANGEALIEAIGIYRELVSENKPFTDVISNLSEEIILTGRKGKNRGKGLGQFYTPQFISDVLTQLALPDDSEIMSWNSPKIVGDICCGAGTLILSFLANVNRVDSEKLNLVGLVLNDIDELACKSTVLQILASLSVFDLQLNGLQMFKADAIKEYSQEGTLYFGFITPESSVKDDEAVGCACEPSLTDSSSERSKNPVTI